MFMCQTLLTIICTGPSAFALAHLHNSACRSPYRATLLLVHVRHPDMCLSMPLALFSLSLLDCMFLWTHASCARDLQCLNEVRCGPIPMQLALGH